MKGRTNPHLELLLLCNCRAACEQPPESGRERMTCIQLQKQTDDNIWTGMKFVLISDDSSPFPINLLLALFVDVGFNVTCISTTDGLMFFSFLRVLPLPFHSPLISSPYFHSLPLSCRISSRQVLPVRTLT